MCSFSLYISGILLGEEVKSFDLTNPVADFVDFLGWFLSLESGEHLSPVGFE